MQFFRKVLWLSVVASVLATFVHVEPAFAKVAASLGEPMRLAVAQAPEAFYFKPRGSGVKPVLMYLHGRGGNPSEDCRKWAKVATEFGWLVCPSGPSDSGNGGRTWSNGAVEGGRIVAATLDALYAKYKGRVRKRGNILMGFSEGAFVAMQVGLKEQATWSRWLILGASEQYWAGDVTPELDRTKRKVRKVYLLTGENDGVAQSTVRVGEILKRSKVPVMVRLVPGMGHEVPQDRMVATYRRPLVWLSASK